MSVYRKKKARERLESSSIAVEYLLMNGESLPMEDNSFKSVVSTWTLCSIQNVAQALTEVRRVLKPGGRFFFLEHGLSFDTKIIKWQNRLNPIQNILGDGRNINRDIKKLIEKAGFKISELSNFYLDKAPRELGFVYKGIATKAQRETSWSE